MYWWIMLHAVSYPFEPLDDEKPKNSRENLKTQQKTQNSRGKLKKSAFFETPGARKAFKKEACYRSQSSRLKDSQLLV